MSDAPDEARTAEFRKQFESLREVLLPALEKIAEISELARLLLEDEEGMTQGIRALCEMLRFAEDDVSPISPPQSGAVLTAAWNEATGWRDFLSLLRGWVIASSNDPEIADRLRRRLNEMMASTPRSTILQEASQNRKTPQDWFDELKAKCPSLRELEERSGVKLELPNDKPPMMFLPEIPPELGSVLSALLVPMFSTASKRFDEDVYLPLARQFESLADLPQRKALPAPGWESMEPNSHRKRLENVAELLDRVTLDQAAAMVNRSKRTLERYKTADKLPTPTVEGGGGRSGLWDWSVIRPWLMKEFNVILPERFPARRA